ncbi:phenylalanine--tRNA ligase subunit beta [Candidatus Saccharibacteria bacterium]|nr:phenylalanine--tRNA ligase subunit beta [Candidatus Saccharibacteria bacterium]
MKISLNWLKKYVEIPEDVKNQDLIRLIGARLVEVEGVIDETHKYDKIYVVKVESCEKIPDTHLTLCQINVGKKDLVQVVCGAPNVREGMLAAWIAPGAIVPASVHEDAPFVIGERKMRGYDSCGMLAGADELDLGDDHSGIVEISPEAAKPGDSLADIFELSDLVLEIENKSLTHRPDCFGIIGFAREVAGILGVKFVEQPLAFKTSGHVADKAEFNPTVAIEKSEICQRYSAVVLEKHGEMKQKYLTWQDTVISKSGMKPIDPIVDATNYLMLLYGQPLHAFDYDKFVKVSKTSRPEIKVRLARDGEKIILLDDTEVSLNENDIVICSGDVPVALAGAMGGKSTMIDENTKNIIIEAATFSLYNLRKTQMAHGIFSEAITRFTKGLSPYQTLGVAGKCAEMLSEGFKIAGMADENCCKNDNSEIMIGLSEINGLLGTDYSKELVIKTLENVGFEVKDRKNLFKITAPAWRMDIHIKEDIIEEVGRLLGYDNISPVLPLHATAGSNAMWELKSNLRDLLVKYGANEILSYSFVSERLLKNASQDTANSYRIVNSISPELMYVRQSLMPSLLEKAYKNEKLPVEKFAIFEMNKVYPKRFGLDSEKVPAEKMSLGILVAERKSNETAFYKAKKYIAKVFEELGVVVKYAPFVKPAPEMDSYDPKRAALIYVGDELIGVVGEFKKSVLHDFKLTAYTAGAEVDMNLLLEKASRKKEIDLGVYKEEDLTVTTDKTYDEALAEVQAKNPNAIITPGTIYQADGQKTRNITFHIKIA